MDWNNLIAIKVWTPINKTGLELNLVAENLYEVGPQAYLSTRPHNKAYCTDEAPYVTRVYWAANKAAILKYTTRDSLAKAHEYMSEPPTVLLGGASGTYENLRQLAIETRPDIPAERAVYSPTNGKFLHKIIELGNIEYYFEKLEVEDNEKPYVIAIGLK